MKKTIYLILIILIAYGKKYQEIQEADLEEFTSISEVWRDRECNRLLYAYTDHDDEEVEPINDWIYEKNHDAVKRYFLIDRSNSFSPPLKVGFYKDSLILLHESESESFSEWWIEVKEKTPETTASTNGAEFAYPDKAVTKKFDKDYLNTLTGGVFKMEGDTLVQVCNYQKYKDWTGIAALGTGVYYFAKPGNFYKYQITLHQIE